MLSDGVAVDTPKIHKNTIFAKIKVQFLISHSCNVNVNVPDTLDFVRSLGDPWFTQWLMQGPYRRVRARKIPPGP